MANRQDSEDSIERVDQGTLTWRPFNLICDANIQHDQSMSKPPISER